MCEFKNHFSEETIKTSVYFDDLLLKQGKSLPHELRIKCAINGQERDFLTHKATYSNLSGEIIGIVGVMLDITERKRVEKALLRTEEIRKKEIHHRIKNNLQVISSLLNLEADHFTDKRVKESFQESQNRVISMSLIPEELYRTEETGDVETFDFKAYIQKLANELFSSYIVEDEKISLKLEIEKIFFGMDSGIPLGIIVNELVSNSLKHAFKEQKSGEIHISLHRRDNSGIERNERVAENPHIPEGREFLLVVSDNGVGFPENLDFKHTSSLGLQLVNILVEQLESSIELGKGPGTEFKLTFREKLIGSEQEGK